MKSNQFQLGGSIAIDDVPDVRRIVEKVQRRVVRNADDMSRMIMAAHELLENAVKFSTDGSASLHIEVKNAQVCITTRNRASVEHLDELRMIMEELGSTDPMAYYLGLMDRSPASRGGLGLGRVAAEGEMQIAFELDGDMVQVHARATLAEPAG